MEGNVIRRLCLQHHSSWARPWSCGFAGHTTGTSRPSGSPQPPCRPGPWDALRAEILPFAFGGVTGRPRPPLSPNVLHTGSQQNHVGMTTANPSRNRVGDGMWVPARGDRVSFRGRGVSWDQTDLQAQHGACAQPPALCG